MKRFIKEWVFPITIGVSLAAGWFLIGFINPRPRTDPYIYCISYAVQGKTSIYYSSIILTRQSPIVNYDFFSEVYTNLAAIHSNDFFGVAVTGVTKLKP